MSNRVLSTPARQQLYGGNGNIIAWAADIPESERIGVGQPSPPLGVREPLSNPRLVDDAPTSEVWSTARALLPELSHGHHTFSRVLTSRLMKLRALRQMWSAGSFEALFEHLRSCHESVAVDCLHALSSCRARVSRSADLEAASDAAVPVLQLAGGMPRWSWPHHTAVSWVASLSPILESLLYSPYEDYLSVALTTVGALQDALVGLFSIAARCSASDLFGPSWDGDEEAASAATSTDDDRRCCHLAANQAVEVVGLTTPLLNALHHATQYRGRVGKAATGRLERLRELHSCASTLVASAAGPGL
jgi:hypothetical protein